MDATSELGCGTERACAHQTTSDSFCRSTLRERSARPSRRRSIFRLGALSALVCSTWMAIWSMPSIPSIARARRSVSPTSCGCFACCASCRKRRYRAYAKLTFAEECTHARGIARRSDSTMTSPQRSTAAFSIGKWSTRARIGMKASSRSMQLNRRNSTTYCANCGYVPANGCSTSAAAGAHWLFGPRSRERRRWESR